MRAAPLVLLASLAVSCGSLHALGTPGLWDTGTTDSGSTHHPGGTDTGTRPQDTSTGTVDTGGQDTGSVDTGSGEDCKVPGDEDHNGLADCEDPACFHDEACVELACSDGLDNDGDGWADCDDDDCWGHGCAASIAAVNGGGHLFAEQFAVAELSVCSGTAYGYFTGTYLTASNVSGSVFTVSAAGGSSWHQCHFVVPRVYALTRRLFSATTYDAVYRPTVSMSGSCNVVDTGFLPQQLRLAWPNVVALDTPSYAPVWYRPGPYLSGSTFDTGTSYSTYGSCYTLWSSAAAGLSASSIQWGTSYFFQVTP